MKLIFVIDMPGYSSADIDVSFVEFIGSVNMNFPVSDYMKSENNKFYGLLSSPKVPDVSDVGDIFDDMVDYFKDTLNHYVLFFALTRAKKVSFILADEDDPEKTNMLVTIKPKYSMSRDGSNYKAELSISTSGGYVGKATVKSV